MTASIKPYAGGAACLCGFGPRCGGLGVHQCAGCGGDQCVCICGGVLECHGCPDCDDVNSDDEWAEWAFWMAADDDVEVPR